MAIADNIFLGRELVRRVVGVAFLDRGCGAAPAICCVTSMCTCLTSMSGLRPCPAGSGRAWRLRERSTATPTSSSWTSRRRRSVAEARKVLGFIDRLRAQGKSVVLISHNIQDIFAISDRSRCCGRVVVPRCARRGRQAPKKLSAHHRGVRSGPATAAGANPNPPEIPYEGIYEGRAGCRAGVSAATTAAEAETRIAFIPQIEGIPYYVAMRQGAEKAAADSMTYVQEGPASTNAADTLDLRQLRQPGLRGNRHLAA